MVNKFPYKNSILSLCKKLNLSPPDDFEQDWEYTASDPSRIDDFLHLYKTDRSLTENEKMTLGILILSSLDDASHIGILSENIWNACWQIFKKDISLHSHTIAYWACWEEDIANCFSISQILRTTIQTDISNNSLTSYIAPSS